MYGIRDVVSYDVMMSRERVEQLKAAGYNPRTNSFNPILTDTEKRALAAMGVRYIVGRGSVEELPGAIPVPEPLNAPPPRILTGVIVSLLALLASVVWLRLYTLAPPALDA